MMKILRDVLSTITRELLTDDVQRMVVRNLKDRQIIPAGLAMGGRTAQAGLSSHIENAELERFLPSDVGDVLEQTSADVDELYLHRRKRAEFVLNVGVIAACLTILAVLLIYVLNSLAQSDWSPSLPAAVGSLFSGTILIFYRMEDQALQKLEHDRREVHRIASLLQLAKSIDDEVAQQAMFAKIVELMGAE